MIEEIIRKGARSLFLIKPESKTEGIESAVWNFLQERRIRMEELVIEMSLSGTFANYKYTKKEGQE
jgi:hypothetical protein